MAQSKGMMIILAMLLAIPTGVSAQTQTGDSLPGGVTAQMIAEGKQIFSGPGVCYACHGQDARGGMGPNLTDTLWVHSRGEYEKIVLTILNGVEAKDSKSGIMMPPRGGSPISDADVRAVAAYIWSFQKVTR